MTREAASIYPETIGAHSGLQVPLQHKQIPRHEGFFGASSQQGSHPRKAQLGDVALQIQEDAGQLQTQLMIAPHIGGHHEVDVVEYSSAKKDKETMHANMF